LFRRAEFGGGAQSVAFNDQFGNIDWKDGDKIRKVIAEEIPAKVSADKAYQNAQKHSDRRG
jgi:type I restriction enzyme R subunit